MYSRICVTRGFEYVTRGYVTRGFRENMRFLKTKTAKMSEQTLSEYSEAEHWYDGKVFCDKNNNFEKPILKKNLRILVLTGGTLCKFMFSLKNGDFQVGKNPRVT